MTWDDWSDKDIGFALTTFIEDVNGWSLSKDESEFYQCGTDGMSYYSVKIIDINNHADMWPIILENDISLINDGEGSIGAAHENCQQIWNKKDKAMRSAAIVFLMMKGVKPDERI